MTHSPSTESHVKASPVSEESSAVATTLRGHRQSRTLAPNLTRRSHKKSRLGCSLCRSRKIKCGEQKPKCSNCLLKGLICTYPTVQQSRKANHPLVKRPVSAPTSTTSFTISDMRFFHHFLTIAYPHLPMGNDHVWVNEIPQFAEHHTYLMHALLSLGASHLARLTGVDYRKEALIHRGHAIAGLNQALSQPAQSYGESDAMLAACYALTFQASYMGDGLADFITMVRGCALTTAKIHDENAPTAFDLQSDSHFKIMAPRLESLPPVEQALLEDALLALDDIEPCLLDETDRNFWRALADVIVSLQVSSATGYIQFIGVYAVWYELCNDSFKLFLDPHNLKAQLLLAYFISIQLLMAPLSVYEWPDRADQTRVRILFGIVEWAEGLFNKLDESEFARHLEWPKRIIATVVAEMTGAQLDGPPVLQLQLGITENCTPPLSVYDYHDMDPSLEDI